MSLPHPPTRLLNARLPAWLTGPAWPTLPGAGGQPALACLSLAGGRVQACEPMAAAHITAAQTPAQTGDMDLAGALVLPGMVDAHVHLDKTFTLARCAGLPGRQPGLLGAIDMSLRDLAHWTPQDIHARATRGMQWAWQSGTTRIRSHVNWSDIGTLPAAWPVLDGIASEWAGRLRLELVSLTKLSSFARADDARTVAAQVAATGPHAVMGGFVHSSNWDATGLRHLLLAAHERGLDLDLHVDEELEPRACGLLHTARILREIGYAGRAVCGHVCALAAQPLDVALATLDEVARAPITLVSLPITNLLLQDAQVGRTPRQRGITLVKEARERGIPLLFASDNVQDPFCHVGSYDPVECMASAVQAAQLDEPFDQWSDALCRHDWLSRAPAAQPALAGAQADLVIFHDADAWSWPSRTGRRTVLRAGLPVHTLMA